MLMRNIRSKTLRISLYVTPYSSWISASTLNQDQLTGATLLKEALIQKT
ncbi:MAG: hypothetical protein MJ252_10545 [archaeon]|nr:hypothetical protein [archaeon]